MCKKGQIHTHTLQPEVNEKDYAWPYPVGPVRFISNIKGLSAVSSPIHQCPDGVSVWSESWSEAESGQLKEFGGGVCVCVTETGMVARARRLMAFSIVWHPRVQWEH